jgi:hypothetical protein
MSNEYGQGDTVEWTYRTPSDEYVVRGYIQYVLSAQYLVRCDDGLTRFVMKREPTLKEYRLREQA